MSSYTPKIVSFPKNHGKFVANLIIQIEQNPLNKQFFPRKTSLKANAKINIGLLIKGKRPDGYHLLETLFYPVELYDSIEMEPTHSDQVIIEMVGFDEQIPLEKNLIWKAWDRLKKAAPNTGGVHITVNKGIPAGAGLGGGSSDAGNVLKGLNEMFDLGLSLDELATIATPLGADVPFFVYNKPLLARGIGNEFQQIDLDIPYDIRVITPEIHSSTVEAYQGLNLAECDPNRSLESLINLPIENWKDQVVNDLEAPILAKYPQIAEIKADLYRQGAIYASMTGSGSAVYGFFEQ